MYSSVLHFYYILFLAATFRNQVFCGTLNSRTSCMLKAINLDCVEAHTIAVIPPTHIYIPWTVKRTINLNFLYESPNMRSRTLQSEK